MTQSTGLGKRLLIVTQAVDLNDPVLGFFHRWIEEFATQCEHVSVICLKEGEHHLPGNVSVYSLGKESGRSRIKYLLRFYQHLWKLRNEYDTVFVHMNQEYVLLGGIFWKLCGKRILLWRNHKKGFFSTRLSAGLADTICYTSPQAYVARYPHAIQMPIGIDTKNFISSMANPTPRTLLFLGRLDRVKNPNIFLDAIELLHQHGIQFHATLYGNPTYPDSSYVAPLRERIQNIVDRGILTVHAAVSNRETPSLYASHAIYVNLTPSGSFDKTIGEAMASGCLVVCCNQALKGVISDIQLVNIENIESVANGLQDALNMSYDKQQNVSAIYKQYIQSHHSLDLLVARVMQIL